MLRLREDQITGLPVRTHARRGLLGGSAVVVAAAMYRSISMWASNAFDLSSPAKILLIGGVIAVAGVSLLLLVTSIGMHVLPTAVCFGGIVLLLMNWQTVDGWIRPAMVVLVVAMGWLGQYSPASGLWGWLAIVFVSTFGLAPILQLVTAHVQDAGPYPLLELPEPQPATASGRVEDVVFVVVDTYPNLQIAETWFGHDAGPLVRDMNDIGFTVEPNAWSQHTFTVLSVSGMLELGSVIDAGPTGRWGNRSSMFRILRGDNLLSQTLESAGFRYTHIESGWDGTSCGPLVDRCVKAPWLDEQVWEMSVPTIARTWMRDRYFTVPGTLHAAEALERELETLVSNSSHDFVFAHFLLPHDPVLVNESCEFRDSDPDRSIDVSTARAAFSDQMSCVDRLLPLALSGVDHDTAVLVTGDHGPSTSGQLSLDPGQWSDADIAERFSVFLAHKFPPECQTPALLDPIAAAAALLSCTLDQTFVPPAPKYLIGADDPELVEPDRMRRIKGLVAAGALPPDA